MCFKEASILFNYGIKILQLFIGNVNYANGNDDVHIRYHKIYHFYINWHACYLIANIPFSDLSIFVCAISIKLKLIKLCCIFEMSIFQNYTAMVL